MSEIGHNGIAADLIRTTVARVERIEAEIKDLNADKSEFYKEVKGQGLDPKIIRLIVRRRAKDTNVLAEEDALFDLYMAAFEGGNMEERAGAHAGKAD